MADDCNCKNEFTECVRRFHEWDAQHQAEIKAWHELIGIKRAPYPGKLVVKQNG